MSEYILIQFTSGLDCQAYQEINNGQVTRYLALDGSVLIMPASTESYVVDSNVAIPEWAVINVE